MTLRHTGTSRRVMRVGLPQAHGAFYPFKLAVLLVPEAGTACSCRRGDWSTWQGEFMGSGTVEEASSLRLPSPFDHWWQCRNLLDSRSQHCGQRPGSISLPRLVSLPSPLFTLLAAPAGHWQLFLLLWLGAAAGALPRPKPTPPRQSLAGPTRGQGHRPYC